MDDKVKVFKSFNKNGVYNYPRVVDSGIQIPINIGTDVYYYEISKDIFIQAYEKFIKNPIIENKNNSTITITEYGCYDCSGTRYTQDKGMIIPMTVNNQISYSLIPNKVIQEAIEFNRKKSLFERFKEWLKEKFNLV